MTTKKHWSDKLKKYNPCEDALMWASEQKSMAEAWRICERGDWMLWLLGKLAGEPGCEKRKKQVLAACDCALLAKKYWLKGDDRPAKAIATARSWARGEGATMEDVRSAAYAAYAAAYAAYAAYAAACAADAAYAADAAADAADAANAAADAAYAAACAADAANAAACAAGARADILKKCADIARKYYPRPPRLT